MANYKSHGQNLSKLDKHKVKCPLAHKGTRGVGVPRVLGVPVLEVLGTLAVTEVLGVPKVLRVPGVLGYQVVLGVLGSETGYHVYTIPSYTGIY